MVLVRIGDCLLRVLDDGTWSFPARAFFANVPEDVWRRELETDREGRIAVGHNHAVLQAGEELVLVDTGYGDDTHGGATGRLTRAFDATGHRREDVTCVVTTHGHGDHLQRHTERRGGRREPTFPRARYYLARADWEWFCGPGHLREFGEQMSVIACRGALVLFDGERELWPGVRLLPTPGHTPGHTSVWVESGGACALLLGDVCHHPLHFAHPDWVSSFDTHPRQTPATRAWLLARAAQRDALVLCPHAPHPGLGRVRRADHGYRWEPWQ